MLTHRMMFIVVSEEVTSRAGSPFGDIFVRFQVMQLVRSGINFQNIGYRCIKMDD